MVQYCSLIGRLRMTVVVVVQVSQLNLARLSQYCSYSMFSNESTESLDSGPASPAISSMHRRLSQAPKIPPLWLCLKKYVLLSSIDINNIFSSIDKFILSSSIGTYIN